MASPKLLENNSDQRTKLNKYQNYEKGRKRKKMKMLIFLFALSATLGFNFIEAMDEVRLSKYLWESNKEIAEKCLQTPFIQQIMEGILDPNVYGPFIINDVYYTSRGPFHYKTALTRDGSKEVRRYIEATMKRYTKYNSEAYKAWHIMRIEAEEFVNPGNAIKGYTSYLQSVAETKPMIFTIVANAPCTVLWSWLGQQMLDGMKSPNAYKNVIPDTFGPDDLGVARVSAILDKEGDNISDERRREFNEIYRRSMEFELKNFQEAVERHEEISMNPEGKRKALV